jgi:hypothetical protein
MSEVVALYKGQTYTLPKQPARKDILNWDLPKKDQKWKRTELPEDWDELSDAKQLAFAEEEDRKCTEGIWLYINGVATYITGHHYFYLNWFMIDSGYPDYRDRDRRWYYHVELCLLDEECLGQAYGKLRRDGYSYRVDAIMLNIGRKTFNANFGIISKTGEDAKEMFKKLVHGFIELPSFFKPQVQSAEDVKKELVLKTPQKRVSYKNRKTSKEISLNTTFDWRNTKENAYDGMKLRIVAVDESGKFPVDVSVEKWFSIGRTCLMLGGTIIGKMFFGSTVNETSKGGLGFKTIWDDSLWSKKTDNGRTLSGLFRYFVPSCDGLEGYIDEYGMSVIDTPEQPVMGMDGKWITMGAKNWILNELKALKDAGNTVRYYEFKRQFPLTEEDMFANPSNDEPSWNIERIYQQKEWNAIHKVSDSIVTGYFRWKDGKRDCGIVEWIPLEKTNAMCKFSLTWLPPVELRNKFEMGKNRLRSPGNTRLGLITLDPYAASKVKDKKRASKAASHGFLKFNMMEDKKRSMAFFMEYWHRLNDNLAVYEDMLMAAVFFGFGVLPESNIRACNDYFTARGYFNYLIMPPKMSEQKYIESKDKEEDPGLKNTDGQTRHQMVDFMSNYVENYIGVNPTTGEMGWMPFDNTLQDLLDFDVNVWTPYDLSVSAMLAVIGGQAITEIRKKPQRQLWKMPTFRREGNAFVSNKK